LRAHAAACPSCRQSADLIELASSSVHERDPIDDPGPAYWREFDRRLQRRLDVRRSPVRFAGLAAAAVLAVAALLFGLRLRTTSVPREQPFPAATPNAAVVLDDTAENDDDVDGGFGTVEPIDDFSDDDRTGLFPTLDRLSPDDAEQLLEWLRSEEARVKKGAT
jgi:hypothetical protein